MNVYYTNIPHPSAFIRLSDIRFLNNKTTLWNSLFCNNLLIHLDIFRMLSRIEKQKNEFRKVYKMILISI